MRPTLTSLTTARYLELIRMIKCHNIYLCSLPHSIWNITLGNESKAEELRNKLSDPSTCGQSGFVHSDMGSEVVKGSVTFIQHQLPKGSTPSHERTVPCPVPRHQWGYPHGTLLLIKGIALESRVLHKRTPILQHCNRLDATTWCWQHIQRNNKINKTSS